MNDPAATGASPGVQRPSNVRYAVLFGLCLAAGLAYVHRGCYGVAEKTIRADLKITEQQTALAASIFFWTYACFQIPTGLLVDRWGARKSLCLFGMLGALTVAIGAGTLIFSATIGFLVLFTSRSLMGIAQAGLFPASTRCIATWFPVRRRAFAAGALQACMSMGGGVGAYITGKILTEISWPWVFIIYAVPGVVWSLWFFSWYRDRPADHPSVNEAENELISSAELPKTAEPRQRAPWLQMTTHPKLLWLCASQYFRAGANGFWLYGCTTYLRDVYKLPQDEAGTLTALPFIGVVLGSLFGGWLSDLVLVRTGSKRWSRNGVSIITTAIGIVFFVLAWYIQKGPHVAITLLFFASLLTSPGNSSPYSVSMDIGGKFVAVVFGAMNMFGNFGSATFPLILSPWTKQFGPATAPLLMGLIYFAGIVCWLFIDPNGTICDARPNRETNNSKFAGSN